jgi:arabinogalactan endo-1,4-beta-galactosidase|tara:strand:- start:412 stop:597 length:186 start_codon:yes stop_codon:yes gene_type:complete
MITDEQVKIWIEKFDSNDTTDLLTDILNNKVKLEIMSDSVFAYWTGEMELAERLYEEMWRK